MARNLISKRQRQRAATADMPERMERVLVAQVTSAIQEYVKLVQLLMPVDRGPNVQRLETLDHFNKTTINFRTKRSDQQVHIFQQMMSKRTRLNKVHYEGFIRLYVKQHI